MGLILDTDFSPDADDVGAVAVLHALTAGAGQPEILAMMISSGDHWSSGALAFTNSYFNRADIPIGTTDAITVKEPSAYTETLARQDPQLEISQHRAVDLYRQVLSAQPDHSVIILAIGNLTNLARLLDSPADHQSPLEGIDLVKRKVMKLVCMGGEYPSGREWNFYQDPVASRTVVERWPTSIVFLGFELGEKVITGKSLYKLPFGSPLHLSYLLHNDFEGRPSWDQLAVLYGAADPQVREAIFSHSPQGLNVVKGDGSNYWLPVQNGPHTYLTLRMDEEDVATVIDNLMFELDKSSTTDMTLTLP